MPRFLLLMCFLQPALHKTLREALFLPFSPWLRNNKLQFPIVKVLRKQKHGSGRVGGGFSGDGMLTELEFVPGAEESLPAVRNQRYDSKSH